MIEYKSKHHNPIDTTIQAMFHVDNYIFIGKKEEAIKKIDKIKSDLIKPFNHITGLGKMFLASNQYNEDEELLDEGMVDIDKFYDFKPHEQILNFKVYGAAFKHLFNKEYDQAIEKFKEVKKLFPGMEDESTRDMIICYNRTGDFDSAIKIGETLIKKNPYAPRGNLELVRPISITITYI